jgi:hypothetical protein
VLIDDDEEEKEEEEILYMKPNIHFDHISLSSS